MRSGEAETLMILGELVEAGVKPPYAWDLVIAKAEKYGLPSALPGELEATGYIKTFTKGRKLYVWPSSTFMQTEITPDFSLTEVPRVSLHPSTKANLSLLESLGLSFESTASRIPTEQETWVGKRGHKYQGKPKEVHSTYLRGRDYEGNPIIYSRSEGAEAQSGGTFVDTPSGVYRLKDVLKSPEGKISVNPSKREVWLKAREKTRTLTKTLVRRHYNWNDPSVVKVRTELDNLTKQLESK